MTLTHSHSIAPLGTAVKLNSLYFAVKLSVVNAFEKYPKGIPLDEEDVWHFVYEILNCYRDQYKVGSFYSYNSVFELDYNNKSVFYDITQIIRDGISAIQKDNITSASAQAILLEAYILRPLFGTFLLKESEPCFALES